MTISLSEHHLPCLHMGINTAHSYSWTVSFGRTGNMSTFLLHVLHDLHDLHDLLLQVLLS